MKCKTVFYGTRMDISRRPMPGFLNVRRAIISPASGRIASRAT